MPGKILIIEDNPANLELMVYLLKAFGYTTYAEEDGEQGLSAVQRVQPALVICDIQLPGLDGYGVIRAIKTNPVLAAIPVIAVTAFAMVGDQDRILAAGFDGCLAKPIDPERFIGQIEDFLNDSQRKRRTSEFHASGSPTNTDGSRTSILVVDDRPDNLLLARSILEPFGYEVFTAPGGREALAAAHEHHPDLILSDVCMGDGNGYDFIRTIKAIHHLAAIPFIFLTSTLIGARHRETGLGLGAMRYLFRPIEPEVLLREIRDCLNERDANAVTPKQFRAARS